MNCPFKKQIHTNEETYDKRTITHEEFGECDEHNCMAYSNNVCILCSDQRVYNLEVNLRRE